MQVLIVGCSVTKGVGLTLEKLDPNLWINQLVTKYYPTATITNLSESGVNNEWIFSRALSEIIRNDYDVVIIGWSELARFGMNLGLETYWTRTMFKHQDVAINITPNITISPNWQGEVGDELRRYYNDHWNILELVKYVNALVYVQEISKKSKIYFVNAMLAWSLDYFTRKSFFTPSELSNFEKNMLTVDTRDDNQILELYTTIHNQYDNVGGIHQKNWLNLYNSLLSMQVDNASEIDNHPGYQSQDIFVEHLSAAMDKILYGNN
jgi:hypothetical protein